MAPPLAPTTRKDSVSFTGVLVASLDLERRPTRYQPFDTVWLFRDGSQWSLATLTRTECWPDDGAGCATSGTALIAVDTYATTPQLEAMILARYGAWSWQQILDAGHSYDSELYRVWVPTQIERDLERATFHRPDIEVGCLDADAREAIALEAAVRLTDAGFNVRDVVWCSGGAEPGENPWVAVATARRYDREVGVVIRIDHVGEVYARIADGSPLRELGDGDA